MSFELRKADSTLEKDPNKVVWVYKNVVAINATKHELFEIFAGELDDWKFWHKKIYSIEWAQPRAQRGTGSERTVKLLGGIEVRESFYTWETDRRIAFCFTKTDMVSYLAFRSGIEDYLLEDSSTGDEKEKTLLTYTVVLEPTLTGRFLDFITSCFYRQPGGYIQNDFRVLFANASNELKAHFLKK